MTRNPRRFSTVWLLFAAIAAAAVMAGAHPASGASPAARAKTTPASMMGSAAAGSSFAAEPSSITPPEAAAVEAASTAPCACGALRPRDQVWLISTRHLGCPDASTPPALRFWQWTGSGWADSTLDAFLAADDPSMPTDFYAHGNFESADDASERGLAVYGRLSGQAPADQPFRFVIWSWPTDRGKHPLELTRMHARRADVDAYYLGWLVNRMNHQVKVGLMGYSLGSRVVTGALHLLGGGQLIGLSLPMDVNAPRQTIRAVLLAAAEDCDWLSPGRPNGEAIPRVEEMLLLNNGCDSVLKRYPHLDPCSRADALGYVGICGPFDSSKVEQLDVCCVVGKQHEWSRYFYTPSLVADMLPYLFLASGK